MAKLYDMKKLRHFFSTCCVRGGEKVEDGGREDGPDGEGPEND